MSDQQPLVISRFFIHSNPNPAKSREQGRPIFDDMECVEITHPGDKLQKKVFPAHEVWKSVENPHNGMIEPTTYAMRFPEQYKAFKNGRAQTLSGTPLEQLPFLTQGKRLELKALSIFTAETLAALDGQPLKQLGQGGRELKNQAQAYIDNAKGSADVTRLASENEQLRARLAELERPQTETATGSSDAVGSPFLDMDDESLKEWLKDATGSRPRGTPSRETLIRMCEEANTELAAKKAKEAA